MTPFLSKLPDTRPSIFTRMSQLAVQHGAINLSQGFPDFDCSPLLVSLVARYMRTGHNQYAPMMGVQALRERICMKVEATTGIAYHPETDITITAGATQALFTAIATLIRPGDEVLLFEPAYDAYAPSVKVFGGIPKPVTLLAPDFQIDWLAVGRLMTERTKLIIINVPNNPTARVFTDADYQQLIRIVRDTGCYVLSDEVYGRIVYDGQPCLSVAHYNELRERAFIVASFGKLYHNTGWKIGYCLAPPHLTAEFRKVHQFNVFSVNTPIQYALADFLREEEAHAQLSAFYQKKRDFMMDALASTRLTPLPSEGTYFLLADYSAISELPEQAFSEALIKHHRVATIPISAFYHEGLDQQLIRICFAKHTQTLTQAIENLRTVTML